MIEEVITYHCHQCSSVNIEKNGTDYKGSQKYHCLDCNKYGTLNPQNRDYPRFFRDLVLRAYRERASMRGIQRIFGIARQTLARWLQQEAIELPDLAETLVPPDENDVLELDELWSFVLKKSEKRWIWIALCRRTRQVVAYYIGDRSEKSCRKLWERIPHRNIHARFMEGDYVTIRNSIHTVIFGSVTKKSFPSKHINRWEKKAVRPIMWNDGITPYVKD